MERWATFDCYGTLVDWNGGIRAELEKLFGVERAGYLLRRYHELEPGIQSSYPGISYREVLTIALEQLAADPAVPVDERPVAVERRPALHAASLVSRL